MYTFSRIASGVTTTEVTVRQISQGGKAANVNLRDPQYQQETTLHFLVLPSKSGEELINAPDTYLN